MKIALLGAGGMIGQRILQEALSRGHEVTAIVRDPARFTSPDPAVKVVVGDALNVESLSAAAAGHDVLINSTSTNRDGDPQLFIKIAHTLLTAVKKSGVPRLIVVGGAGSLYVAPGVQAVDTPQFPAEWRPGAAALRDALEIYRTADFDWLFISPAAYIHPGERTGKYRVGGDDYMVDANGNSEITCEDYAVGLLDQAEQAAPFKRRIALAY
jgi:putative NADH-flavin reductase